MGLVTAVHKQGALVWAAACGWLECVQLLLEVHQTSHCNPDGAREALHAAARVGAAEVCRALLAAKFDVSLGLEEPSRAIPV